MQNKQSMGGQNNEPQKGITHHENIERHTKQTRTRKRKYRTRKHRNKRKRIAGRKYRFAEPFIGKTIKPSHAHDIVVKDPVGQIWVQMLQKVEEDSGVYAAGMGPYSRPSSPNVLIYPGNRERKNWVEQVAIERFDKIPKTKILGRKEKMLYELGKCG